MAKDLIDILIEKIDSEVQNKKEVKEIEQLKMIKQKLNNNEAVTFDEFFQNIGTQNISGKLEQTPTPSFYHH